MRRTAIAAPIAPIIYGAMTMGSRVRFRPTATATATMHAAASTKMEVSTPSKAPPRAAIFASSQSKPRPYANTAIAANGTNGTTAPRIRNHSLCAAAAISTAPSGTSVK